MRKRSNLYKKSKKMLVWIMVKLILTYCYRMYLWLNGNRFYSNLSFFSSHINEDKRKTENQVVMFDIMNDIDNCPVSIIGYNNRKHLIYKAIMPSPSPSLQPYVFFFFKQVFMSHFSLVLFYSIMSNLVSSFTVMNCNAWTLFKCSWHIFPVFSYFEFQVQYCFISMLFYVPPPPNVWWYIDIV